MEDKEKLCLRCMRKFSGSNVCPYCRNEKSEPKTDPYLPLKATVGAGRYLIGKLVHTDSEGHTYYAYDNEAKTPVTLREFYPAGLVSRGEENYCLVEIGRASEFINAKEDFIRLRVKYASLGSYGALTPVLNAFEENGTCYVVTEFLGDGKTLRDFLLEHEQGYISWEEAEPLFMPVLTALEEMHRAGIVHGGISPTTLILDKTGRLRITDCRTAALRRHGGFEEPEIFDGYAAVEQYGDAEPLTEATDVYAIAAVLYRALIGSTPMTASARLTNDKLMIPGKFAEQLPAYVINALVNALQILPADRTQSVETFHAEISASPAAAAASVSAAVVPVDPEPVPIEEEPLPEPGPEDAEEPFEEEEHRLKGSTIAAFVISLVLCLALIVAVVIGITRARERKNETTTSEGYTYWDSTGTTEEITGGAQDPTEPIQMEVPNFVNLKYDDVVADETYKYVLKFSKKTDESDKDIGVIINQSVNPGTRVSSNNPKTIYLTVSIGKTVPTVNAFSVSDAIQILKNNGFNNVTTRQGDFAPTADKVGDVYLIGVAAGKGWDALPQDRCVSASSELVLYYYVEKTQPTTTTEPPVTAAPTQAPTQAPTEAPPATAAPTEQPDDQAG